MLRFSRLAYIFINLIDHFLKWKIAKYQSLRKISYFFKWINNRGSHLSCVLTQQEVLALFHSPTHFLQKSKFSHWNYFQADIFKQLPVMAYINKIWPSLSQKKKSKIVFLIGQDFIVIKIIPKLCGYNTKENKNILSDKFCESLLLRNGRIETWKFFFEYHNCILKT